MPKTAFSTTQQTQIRRRLLTWYDRHCRDLPWRRRQSDPYAQLLAEMMLQQTQVATVIDYYNRFIERFPTVKDLADADMDEILAMWSGLGYYRRARHLHAAARQVVDEFGGVVPRTVEELITLPGVGRYTAGAVASVAYDVRAPILDGNVTRVLCRLAAIPDDPAGPAVQKTLWSLAETLLPRKRCGSFNQGLMELGSLVCTPQGPVCPRCPLRMYCGAYQKGLTDRIPAGGARTRVVPTAMVVAAVRRGEALLFSQRPADGLWAGLWELPSEPLSQSESLDAARRRLRKRLPPGTRLAGTVLGTVERLLSHRRVTFHVYAGTCSQDGEPAEMPGSPLRWVTVDQRKRLGMSRACEAVLKLVDGKAAR